MTEWGSKEQIMIASRQLIGSMADLQDTLCLKLEGNEKSDSPEMVGVRYSSEALAAFADSNFELQTVNPRSIRDQDRRKMLPGQHSGVYAQFGSGDGTILKVNFWGGLRILTSFDLKDGDPALRRSHTKTTDKVLEQPVQINWQLSLPGGPEIDNWVVLNQEKGFFQLSSLLIDHEKIDVHPTIPRADKYFNEMRTSICSAMRDLTSSVPSST